MIIDTEKKFVTFKQLARILDINYRPTLEKIIEKFLKTGLLERLEPGKYRVTMKDASVYEIARFLYKPSYVSLESALSYHGILSASPEIVTSVTLRKPKKKFVNGLWYTYSKITPRLFFGYKRCKGYSIAHRSKAVFDYLYFIAKGQRTIDALKTFNLSYVRENKVRRYVRYLTHRQTQLKILDLVDLLFSYQPKSFPVVLESK